MHACYNNSLDDIEQQLADFPSCPPPLPGIPPVSCKMMRPSIKFGADFGNCLRMHVLKCVISAFDLRTYVRSTYPPGCMAVGINLSGSYRNYPAQTRQIQMATLNFEQFVSNSWKESLSKTYLGPDWPVAFPNEEKCFFQSPNHRVISTTEFRRCDYARYQILRSTLHAVRREKNIKRGLSTTNGAHFQQSHVLVIVDEASGLMDFIALTYTAHFGKVSVSNCPLEPSCRMICSCNRTSAPTSILAIL